MNKLLIGMQYEFKRLKKELAKKTNIQHSVFGVGGVEEIAQIQCLLGVIIFGLLEYDTRFLN